MESVRDTIVPKSDQLNTDDLLSGPITVEITGVTRGTAEQPVCVAIKGHQPFKPCKSMRRVLVACWGEYAKNWVGKSLTLYADPNVKYGGVRVGGIRISHASGIADTMRMMLTTTRGKREEYTVQPLVEAMYPEAEFTAKLPAMLEQICGGKMTPAEVVARCEKRGKLTLMQIAKLNESVEG